MSDANTKQGVEFGWRIHGALDSWIGKVDTKASIALAIESAIFGFLVTLSDKNRVFASLTGARECGYRIGLGLVLVAALMALAAVLPQLNRRKSKRGWRDNTIYFGHLRRWDPGELAKTLGNSQSQKEQLARQIVAMSKIAWRKHAWLQASLILLVLGVGCLLAVAATA